MSTATKTATLIDAKHGFIREVDVTDFRSIQAALGVDCFDCVRVDANGETLYVDDEGLINGTKFGFTINGRPFAGNGLILGTTESGRSRSTKIRPADLVADFRIGFWENEDGLDGVATNA